MAKGSVVVYMGTVIFYHGNQINLFSFKFNKTFFPLFPSIFCLFVLLFLYVYSSAVEETRTSTSSVSRYVGGRTLRHLNSF